MNREDAAGQLERVVRLSREILPLAEAGDAGAAAELDRQRRELLAGVRAALEPLSDAEQAMIAEVAALNDRALGALEHRLRIKAREIDVAAAGRRAVAAYGATG